MVFHKRLSWECRVPSSNKNRSQSAWGHLVYRWLCFPAWCLDESHSWNEDMQVFRSTNGLCFWLFLQRNVCQVVILSKHEVTHPERTPLWDRHSLDYQLLQINGQRLDVAVLTEFGSPVKLASCAAGQLVLICRIALLLHVHPMACECLPLLWRRLLDQFTSQSGIRLYLSSWKLKTHSLSMGSTQIWVSASSGKQCDSAATCAWSYFLAL